MPKIELNIPHELSQAEALTRIQNFPHFKSSKQINLIFVNPHNHYFY
jgi:hypothetical protein